MYLNCLALQSFYISLFICVIGTKKKDSVQASGNCICKQWPLTDNTGKNGWELCELWTCKNANLKMCPLQVHKTFTRTWQGFSSGSTSGKKGLNYFRKLFGTLFCQSSAIVSSSLYSMTSLKQFPLFLLPWENQAWAEVVLQMLRCSQKVKKKASFHSARAPCWFTWGSRWIKVVFSLCHSYREQHQDQLFHFHNSHCITWRFKEDLIYLYHFSLYPLI